MEFHKPRPIHNLRQFFIELGTIVLGVCIALAAEQTVEYFHWRGQVADARDVIATELTTNLEGAFHRVRMADCVDRRLGQLGLILDEAAKKGSLPPLGDIGVPYRSTYPDGAWESVIASQTATHFTRQQLADIAILYKGIERLREFNSQELMEWNSLYAMVGPGRRLDPSSEARLRDALSQARADSRSAAYLATTLIDRIRIMHIRFGRDDLARLAAVEHDPSILQTGICAPIGAVPATYGQGLVTPIREQQLRQIVTHPPDFSEGAR